MLWNNFLEYVIDEDVTCAEEERKRNYGYLVSFYSHSSICWRNRKEKNEEKKNYCYQRLIDE